MTIERVSNGYILTDRTKTTVYVSIEELLNAVMFKLTGCSKYFGESLFGEVKVNIDHNKRLTLTDFKKE